MMIPSAMEEPLCDKVFAIFQMLDHLSLGDAIDTNLLETLCQKRQISAEKVVKRRLLWLNKKEHICILAQLMSTDIQGRKRYFLSWNRSSDDRSKQVHIDVLDGVVQMIDYNPFRNDGGFDEWGSSGAFPG